MLGLYALTFQVDRKRGKVKGILAETDRALNRVWKPGDAMDLPIQFKGKIMVQKYDPKTHTKSSFHELAPDDILQFGDLVEVPEGGEITLLCANGKSAVIKGGSTFGISRVPGHDPGEDEADESKGMWGPEEADTVFSLIKGYIHVGGTMIDDVIHYKEHHRYDYRNHWVVFGVRGTEFDMSADEKGVGHLIPFSGKFDISADDDRPPVQPWSLDASRISYAGPEGKAAGRIAAIVGGSDIVEAKGGRHAAKAGESLAPGQQIATGPDGMALVDFAQGERIEIAEGSVLSLGTEPRTGSLLYVVKQGRARYWGPGKELGSRMLTPNTVIEPRATEFDVAIVSSGAADFAVGGGSITVTAVASRLDQSKIDKWWKKPSHK